MNLKKSYFFSITEKGSTLLIEEFPSRDDLDETQETIEKIYNWTDKNNIKMNEKKSGILL